MSGCLDPLRGPTKSPQSLGRWKHWSAQGPAGFSTGRTHGTSNHLSFKTAFANPPRSKLDSNCKRSTSCKRSRSQRIFHNDAQKMVQIPAFSSSAMSAGLPIDKAFWRLPSWAAEASSSASLGDDKERLFNLQNWLAHWHAFTLWIRNKHFCSWKRNQAYNISVYDI